MDDIDIKYLNFIENVEQIKHVYNEYKEVDDIHAAITINEDKYVDVKINGQKLKVHKAVLQEAFTYVENKLRKFLNEEFKKY